MRDAEKIEPALTAEEWAIFAGGSRQELCRLAAGEFLGHGRMAEGIALANAALPDTDPRKITRAMVEDIRHGAAEVRLFHPQLDRLGAALDTHADALASYLPPE